MTQVRKNKKKWIWWGCGIAAVVALVVIVGVVIAVNNNGGNSEAEQDGASVVEESDSTEQATEMSDEDIEAAKKDEDEKRRTLKYEGDDPNDLEELTGVVTYAGVNDGVLMVRMSIDQYLTEGTCELTLARSGDIIYSDKADIVGDVSTAMCKGFDVPSAELGGGNVEITINLSADGKTGVIRGEASI